MEIQFSGKKMTDYITPKLDDLIECFVEYFGEKYRSKITDRIKSVKMFFIPQLDGFIPDTKNINMYKEMQNYYDSKIKDERKKLPNVVKTAKDWNRLLKIRDLANNREIDIAKARKICQPFVDAYKNYENVENLGYISALKKFGKVDNLSEQQLQKLVYTWQLLQTVPFKLPERKKDQLDDIKLFNALGYEFKKPKDYYKCDQLYKLIYSNAPQKEVEKLEQKYMKEFIKFNPFLINAIDTIKKEKLVSGTLQATTTAVQFVLDSCDACCAMFYNTGSNDLSCYMFLQDNYNLATSTIIHEFVHVISSNFDKLTTAGYLHYKVGVNKMRYVLPTQKYSLNDLTSQIIDDPFEDIDSNNCELNEIITDYFAHQINLIAQKRGLKLGVKPNFDSYYSLAFPFFKDFIENNKQALFDCFVDNSFNHLCKQIGESNFKNISKLATKFFDILSRNIMNNCFIKIDDVVLEIADKTNLPASTLKKYLPLLQSNLDYDEKYSMYYGKIQKAMAKEKFNIFNNYKKYYNKDLNWSTNAKFLFNFIKDVENQTKEIETYKKEFSENNTNELQQL